jgi:serine protease Do
LSFSGGEQKACRGFYLPCAKTRIFRQGPDRGLKKHMPDKNNGADKNNGSGRKSGLLVGTIVGLGVAAAAAAGVGVQWPAAMAAETPLIKASTAPIFAPPPGAPLSFADIFERVAPAVVQIDVTTHLSQKEMQQINPFQGLPFGLSPRGGQGDGLGGNDGDDNDDDSAPAPAPRGHGRSAPSKKQLGPTVQASGSGFFISPDGYIVTNNHVVENADTIKVKLEDKRELTAKVVGRDEGTDVAVLKVEGSGYPYVNFEDSAKPRVGDWVLAIGNPLGLGGTATAGIVSTLARSLPDNSTQFADYIQIDAPINRGNSGGPTFDIYGRVIGMNTAIYSPNGGSIGIGFDIPAATVSSIAKQLIAAGKVTRGYLGVTIQSVGDDNAESLGLKPDEGAMIMDVTPGGPGAKAGMQVGDIVLTVNGHAVTSNTDLTRQVAVAHAGEVLHLGVLRDGRHIDVDVRSGVRPSESELALNNGGEDQGGDNSASPDKSHAARPQVLGMSLAPLDDAARRKYNLGATAHGVVVDAVKDDSEAAQTGFHAGVVIARAGERAVTTPADVAAAVADARKAGRKGVFFLVTDQGRNVGVTLKFDTK